MQEDKNHISFTAEDIRRYHEGQLTPRQMHELEKAALEDPFLADALEGYAGDEVRIPADINELKKRLQERVEDKKIIPITASHASTPFRWLKVAAMIVAVAGAGLIVYNLGFNTQRENAVAKNETTQQTTILPDQKYKSTDVVLDSISSAGNSIATTTDQTLPAKDQAFRKDTRHVEEPATANNATASMPAEEAKPQPPAKTGVPDAVNGTLAQTRTVPAAETEFKKQYAEQEFRAKADSTNLAQRSYLATQNNTKDLDKALNVATAAPAQNNSQGMMRAKREQALRPQPNIFRGKVTDDQNNPLPFANITNNRDNIGTYADAQGNFILTSPDSTMNVQVRSLGFENNNIQLQNGLSINRVEMKDDNSIAAIVLSNKKVNSKLRQNSMVLEEPEPADGWTKYDDYLANNLKIPDDIEKTKTQGGQVELSFEVNQLGEPFNIRVEKSLCEVCDKEAIRLLKEGPKWKRKAKKGKRTSITVPF